MLSFIETMLVLSIHPGVEPARRDQYRNLMGCEIADYFDKDELLVKLGQILDFGGEISAVFKRLPSIESQVAGLRYFNVSA